MSDDAPAYSIPLCGRSRRAWLDVKQSMVLK